MDTGAIVCTYVYRPVKAAANIKAGDSLFQLVCTKELYLYPGAGNRRVRWEKETLADAGADTYAKAISFARSDYARVIKEAKSQIINPLADKRPIFLLRASGLFAADEANTLCIADESGNKLLLRLEAFGSQLGMASGDQIRDGALACRFAYDIADDLLYAVPLSLVTRQGIVRFFY